MSEEKEVQGEVIETSDAASSNQDDNATAQNASSEQQGGQQQQAPKQSYEPAAPSADERNWAMFCHLATMSGFVIPFFSIIGPLVIWLIKRDESEYVNYHGKEVLNFQITIAIAMFVSIILMVVVIGFVTAFIVGIFWFVMSIVGGVKASSGEYYEYPFTLRLIS